MLDRAVDAGWTLRRACQVLEVDVRRARRWQRLRAADGDLANRASGGNPVHGLRDTEVAEILTLYEQWGEIDASHRKLAHRGSYLRRVWVSPSSVLRVLAAHGKVLPSRPRPAPTAKRPWPDWVQLRPDQVWG